MNYRGIIAIAIVMGIAGLSLVGCPDNTGDGVDATAPAQVTELTQSRSGDGTSITLSWVNPADADLETIRITVAPSISDFPLNVDANGASLSQTQTVTGVDAATDYTFTVRTVDTTENVSASSSAPTVTVPRDAIAPAQVTGLTQARSADSTSVTLSWTNPADADVQTIRIAIDPALPASALPSFPLDVEANGASMSQSQTVTGLDDATDYTFTVRTVDTLGNVSASSGAPTVTAPFVPDTTAPGQVTAAAAVGLVDSGTLSWTNPADADLSYISITWTPTTSGPTQPIETPRAATVATTQLITGLDAGTLHTFTIRTVDTTGNLSDSSDAPTVTATTGTLEFTAIGAGTGHTCALRGGTVFCWGSGRAGRLGIGDAATGNQLTPVAVSLADVSALSVAASHVCAIADATAYCWGSGYDGNLGNGAYNGIYATPVAVLFRGAGIETNLTDVSAISAGFSHTCAIAGSNNAAYCWGSKRNGRLGNGATTGIHTTPIAVLSGESGAATNLTDVSAISAGGAHTCAIAGSNNAAYCWGRGVNGQLGNGAASDDQAAPVAVMGPLGTTALTGVTAIFTGTQHACAIANNIPYCWGGGANGSLGSNTTDDQSRPVLVVAANEMGTPPTSGADSRTPLAAVTSISTDGDRDGLSPRSCAVAGSTNIAYCWGTGGDALGIGASTADQLRPAAVQGVGASGMPNGMPNGMISGIVAISVGVGHTCAISPDAAYCWGLDTVGQLGNGAETASQSSPVDITDQF